MTDDPLLAHRFMPREAEPALRERILAIIGPDMGRMHLVEVRLALQERLHREFGIHVVIQDPMDSLDRIMKERTVANTFDVRAVDISNGPAIVERKFDEKKATIPIPGYRRKRWE